MKFFLISNMYPTIKYPGYGSFVKNVCDGLVSYEMIMIYKAVIRGKSEGFISKIFKYLYFYISIIYGFFKNYDFIYIHFPNQAILLLELLYKLKNKPIVVNFHGEDLLFVEKGYTKYIGDKTLNFCSKYANAIVVPSKYFKNIVIEKKIISSDKIIISPSGGINSNFFFPTYNEKSCLNTILHIGYVGRIEEDKGICEFLITCKKLKNLGINFKGTIIGYGSYYYNMISFIEENKLKAEITIINGVPQAKLGNYYRDMDLLIFSSSRTSESLGLTGIEAMACGTPVIGSNIGGIASYVIDNFNGWLVPIHDTDAIVNKILKYININKDFKDNMKRNCIETGKKYYQDAVCKQLSIDIKKQLSFINSY